MDKMFVPRRTARWYYQDAYGWYVGMQEASSSEAYQACLAGYAQAHECAEFAARWEAWWEGLDGHARRCAVAGREVVAVGY